MIGKKIHKLSDIEPEIKTATCSICGPVGVRIRKGSRFTCLNRELEYNKTWHEKNKNRRKFWKSKNKSYMKPKNYYGTCKICGKEQTLVQDHCHSTGFIRDKLCRRCNLGLGMFKDDSKLLIAAVQYLNVFQEKHKNPTSNVKYTSWAIY